MQKFRCVIGDKTGKLIPHGILEHLTVEVYNGWAVFHFKDVKTTRRFAALAREMESKGLDNTKTSFNERLQKYITFYPNMSEEQIFEKLKKELNDLGGVIK